MKIAVVSDIHGNLDAFEKVLDDIDQTNVEHIISLGDCVGYGAEPQSVLEILQTRQIESVMGNHEVAVLDKNYRNKLNPSAQKSILITRDLLDKASLKYIKTFPLFRIFKGCRFVHGFPPDSVYTYAFQVSTLALSGTFNQMKERICFIGHTHVLEIITFQNNKVTRLNLTEGTYSLSENNKYIINIGSVGQPRDGSNPAKYAIYDTTTKEIEIRSIPYDISAATKKIIHAGFPKGNANRLW